MQVRERGRPEERGRGGGGGPPLRKLARDTPSTGSEGVPSPTPSPSPPPPKRRKHKLKSRSSSSEGERLVMCPSHLPSQLTHTHTYVTGSGKTCQDAGILITKYSA